MTRRKPEWVKLQYRSRKLDPDGNPYSWHHVVEVRTATDWLLTEKMRFPDVEVRIERLRAR